jgi:NAD(P)-dependent dehydrogenase (short-subunit alcohol dehydrogenase family)
MNVDLTGKRVIITAAGSGIGAVMAGEFAGAGARVHICDIDRAALAAFAQEHPGVGTTVADVADPAQVDALFDAAATSFGGLDVLVNNAGIAGPTAAVEEIAVADWERTISVNLNSMFIATRRAVPLLKDAGGGSIVNLSSVAGRLGYALRTPYAASKWAVVGLTKSLAIELGPHNIRVNAIQPGIVGGDRVDRVISARAEALGLAYEEMRDKWLEHVSLRRTVAVEEVAAMALFLCSPAGAAISGQALSVCGDLQVLP